MIPAVEYSDAATMRANYAIVRRRLYGKPPERPRPPPPEPPPPPVAEPQASIETNDKALQPIIVLTQDAPKIQPCPISDKLDDWQTKDVAAGIRAIVAAFQAREAVAGRVAFPVLFIQRHAARAFDVRMKDLIGPWRTLPIVRARQIAMALVKHLRPTISLPEIGRRFDRDHTTVLHAVRKMAPVIAAALEQDQ